MTLDANDAWISLQHYWIELQNVQGEGLRSGGSSHCEPFGRAQDKLRAALFARKRDCFVAGAYPEPSDILRINSAQRSRRALHNDRFAPLSSYPCGVLWLTLRRLPSIQAPSFHYGGGLR